MFYKYYRMTNGRTFGQILFTPLIALVMTATASLAQPVRDQAISANSSSLTPPAIPLITIDPYTSIWSFGGTLNADPTRHWTGRSHALNGLIRVDGRVYRFMGKPTFTGDTLVESALKKPYQARYTTDKPADNWAAPDYDDHQWATGEGTFGSRDKDRTKWTGRDIWVRRVVDVPSIPEGRLLVSAIYNDNYELFVNGQRVAGIAGVSPNYELTATSKRLTEVLRPGRNVLAFHSQNFNGPGFVDLGLLQERELDIQAATQTGVRMTATQSVFTFMAGGVELTVTFMAPLLMNNLEVLSRPVQYVTYSARATDGKQHAVQLYSDASTDLAVDSPDQPVVWRRGRTTTYGPALNWMRVGTAEQKVLGRKGDNVRIDWGHLYVATPGSQQSGQRIGSLVGSLNQFEREGRVTDTPDEGRPTIAMQNPTVLATTFDLGTVTAKPQERHWLLAYDDIKSVEYFGKPLKAWWRRYTKDTDARNAASPDAAIEQAMQAAETDYLSLRKQCDAFDAKLYTDANAAGGAAYADLCVLAYRQAIAAHKLVARPDGTPLFFSKENFSNGSIGTVDVTYPSAPLFLLYNPTLLKGMMEPIFEYSESGRWTKPFAAHDVGTYPLANGQTYGEDMPVEECGNMLILTAAIAAVEGNAKFAQQHWESLTTWTTYLKEHGFDPENQLCTDDFAGHLARNANLSVKAIMGIASYGYLARMMGNEKLAEQHIKLARELARKWMVLADKGTHYALTFNQSDGDTWSQKYNLIWDKLLKLDRTGEPIFPREVAQREVAYYLTKQQTFGLPLDSRRTYTKSDWIIWTATLADQPAQFNAFVEPVLKFANQTPDRIPLSDWHETTNGKHVGFRARSVVGGYFIKMLEKKLK